MTQVATVSRRRRRIDTRAETPVLLSLFGKLLEPKKTYWTIRDYVENGRKSELGNVVKLESVNTPSGRATTMAAYHRFIDDLNDA